MKKGMLLIALVVAMAARGEETRLVTVGDAGARLLDQPSAYHAETIKAIDPGTALAVIDDRRVPVGRTLVRFFKVKDGKHEGWISEENTTGKVMIETPDGLKEEPRKSGHPTLTAEELDAKCAELAKIMGEELAKIQKGSTVLFSGIQTQCTGTQWYLTLSATIPWGTLDYDLRLAVAKAIWNRWQELASPDDPDKARISIQSVAGREIGGSRMLGGSLIWVEK
ncbi:MAG: hypothetical protein QM845_02670 [Verrucomicrobiota bacterium]|nr:hypothetical protein [Verrucomicrobiota bacterium]